MWSGSEYYLTLELGFQGFRLQAGVYQILCLPGGFQAKKPQFSYLQNHGQESPPWSSQDVEMALYGVWETGNLEEGSMVSH